MKEYILDIHRCADAPRHLFFNMTVNDTPYFGQFTNCKIGEDLYYHKKSVTLQPYKRIDKFSIDIHGKPIEDIPTEQIKILEIIDKDSNADPTPFSTILELSDKIYHTDLSFERYVVKEKLLKLFNELKESINEYAKEHPNSDHKTPIAFLNQEETRIQKFDSNYADTEKDNRETVEIAFSHFKEEFRIYMLAFIFSPQYQ